MEICSKDREREKSRSRCFWKRENQTSHSSEYIETTAPTRRGFLAAASATKWSVIDRGKWRVSQRRVTACKIPRRTSYDRTGCNTESQAWETGCYNAVNTSDRFQSTQFIIPYWFRRGEPTTPRDVKDRSLRPTFLIKYNPCVILRYVQNILKSSNVPLMADSSLKMIFFFFLAKWERHQ